MIPTKSDFVGGRKMPALFQSRNRETYDSNEKRQRPHDHSSSSFNLVIEKLMIPT